MLQDSGLGTRVVKSWLSSVHSDARCSSARRSSSEAMDISLVAPLLLTGVVTTRAVASAAGVSIRTINRQLASSDTPRPAANVLTDAELDTLVAEQVDKLGSNYGYRMVIGALRAAHPNRTFAKRRVQAAIARHNPMAHAVLLGGTMCSTRTRVPHLHDGIGCACKARPVSPSGWLPWRRTASCPTRARPSALRFRNLKPETLSPLSSITHHTSRIIHLDSQNLNATIFVSPWDADAASRRLKTRDFVCQVSGCRIPTCGMSHHAS